MKNFKTGSTNETQWLYRRRMLIGTTFAIAIKRKRTEMHTIYMISSPGEVAHGTYGMTLFSKTENKSLLTEK